MSKEEKKSIISIAILVAILATTIWMVIFTIVTAQKYSKQKAELEEYKQELSKYKADEKEDE